MFGVRIMESLKESDIEVLEYREMDSVRIEDIVDLAKKVLWEDERLKEVFG